MEFFEMAEPIGIEKAAAEVLWWDFIDSSMPYAILSTEAPQQTQESLKRNRGNRRADCRAQIARYTRAVLRATNVDVKKKKSKGFDEFLQVTYGLVFMKGEHWYENPDPYDFFKYLIDGVMQGGALLDKEGFENLFYKAGAKRGAKWIFNDKVGARLGISSRMIKEAIDKVRFY
jgi:hypothetical protein